MTIRLVAVGLILATVVFVGFFVGAVLRPPVTVSSNDLAGMQGAAAGAKQLTGQIGAWTVTAEINDRTAGSVAIVVSVADAEGQPATAAVRPTAALRMIGMGMGVQPVTLMPDAPGLWRGSSRVAMGGRWNLQIDIDGSSTVLPFETVPR
jgi:hypothetical protein